MRSLRLSSALVAGALLVLAPAPAAAQWYIGTFTGANATHPATVRIEQPARRQTLEFQDVRFEARPLEWPQYYGARIGRRLADGRVAIEVEFLHTKVIAETADTVRVTGHTAAGPIDHRQRMDAVVQRYAMTHGLNFFLANIVWRTPFGGADATSAALEVRAGAGPVVPGAYTVVGFEERNGYQFAGFGAQLAAGIDLHVAGPFSLLLEYKLTGAQPCLDLAVGRGRTTAISHHLAIGFSLSRWP